MKIAVVQTSPTGDLEHNLSTIRRFAAEAAAAGASLIVFPEEAGLLAEDDVKPDFPRILPNVWPRFEELIIELAKQHGVTIIAGCYEPNGAEAPYNTILAVSPSGEELARYHKVHLYDAFSYRESDYVTHGSELAPVIEVAGFKVGIGNCYDVRFPELFRSMADRGADIISLSAAWVSGKGKEEHWSVLTQARAIENVSWLLASGTVADDAVGLSRIIDPLGLVVASAGTRDEGIVFAEVTRESIDRARKILPALDNRRLETAVSVKGN